MENNTFKMNDLLADMRSIESCSREDAWPTQFTNKNEIPVPINLIMVYSNIHLRLLVIRSKKDISIFLVLHFE